MEENSFPRPPCGGRPSAARSSCQAAYFYPRPPCGGRLFCRVPPRAACGISIHVPLAGDDHQPRRAVRAPQLISIHVPLAGDDSSGSASASASRISIHVPLAGDDTRHLRLCQNCPRFLSTSPLRGTTHRPKVLQTNFYDFYPRPPCGGRPGAQTFRADQENFYPRPPCGGRRFSKSGRGRCYFISIHVPLAGDDIIAVTRGKLHQPFLSTSPLRGTTHPRPAIIAVTRDFYPRPPCGGRRQGAADL